MKRLALFVLLGAFAFPACAGDAGDVYGALMGTYVITDKARDADHGLGGTALIGLPVTKNLSLEPNFWGDVMHRKSNGQRTDEQFGAGLDLNLQVSDGKIQSFLIFGGGAERDHLGLAPKDNAVKAYADAGAGLIIRLSQHLAIRGDGRYYVSFDRSDSYPGQHTLGDPRVNLGLEFSTGTVIPSTLPPKPEPVVAPPPPPPPPPPPVDSDGDGVPDPIDQCPDTPAGVKVDSRGCPLDSDGDGVPDYLDKCPGTPHGFKVDATGCVIEQTVILLNVNFEFGKAALRPESKLVLDGIAAGLAGQPSLKVEVSGHTDSIGSAAANLKLSKSRAASVVSYLVGKGVDPHRLSAQGYGKTKPIADNKTDAGRAENRRVEFKVLGGDAFVQQKTAGGKTIVKVPLKKHPAKMP